MKILFWFRKSKRSKKEGKIYCRLYLDGNRLEISTDLECQKKKWDAARQKATGEGSDYLNEQLDRFKTAIRTFDKEAKCDGMERLRWIRDRLNAKTEKAPVYNLSWLLANYLEIKLPTRNEYSPNTQKTIRSKLEILKFFLKEEEIGEMPVPDFKAIHARKCYQWIREKEYSHNTTVKVCQIFKEAFRYAIEENVTTANPFDRLKLAEVAAQLDYLTKEQLKILESYPYPKKELAYTVDLFLLMCYTGMNISDLPKLNPEHFYMNGGRTWLKYVRKKSAHNKPALIGNIPIFPEVQRILEKYDNRIKVYTGQAINRNLRQVETELGFSVHLTTKLGRKTCGHMLLNEMGLSVDAASSILGNSIRTFLKNYANVRMERIAMELDKLA